MRIKYKEIFTYPYTMATAMYPPREFEYGHAYVKTPAIMFAGMIVFMGPALRSQTRTERRKRDERTKAIRH